MTSHRSQNATVDFVGAGAMGAPMIAALAAAGYEVGVHDVDRSRAAAAADVAGAFVTDLADIATGDVILLMLPDSDAVEAVLLGGALRALPEGALIVDMGSSDPRRTRDLASTLAEGSVQLVDAPVSGGVRRARTRELTIMVGATDQQFALLSPLFGAMGSSVIHVGDVGAGHAAKALNNLMSAAGLLIAIEAVEVASRFGIDPYTFVELVNRSSGRSNATETKLAQFVLNGSYDSGFAARLMAKDVLTAAELCADADLQTDLAASVSELWGEAIRILDDDADHTQIALVTVGATDSSSDQRQSQAIPR